MRLQHELSVKRFTFERERFELEKNAVSKREKQEENRYKIERKLIVAEANIKIAQSNAMMRMEREKWKQTHPDATEEFLDANYPLSTPIQETPNDD